METHVIYASEVGIVLLHNALGSMQMGDTFYLLVRIVPFVFFLSSSACGIFALLGTAGGWIERFNLQSGITRGSYRDASEIGSCAHGGEVVGIACDATNTLVLSAGYHGDIKVWDFKVQQLKSRWEVGCILVKIVYNCLNGLLATVADDLIIHLFDVVAS